MFPKNAFTLQKFPNHKTIEDPDTTEHVLENLYPNTLYHVWVAAKSRRGEGAATPKLSVRTEQYGESWCKGILTHLTDVQMVFRQSGKGGHIQQNGTQDFF